MAGLRATVAGSPAPAPDFNQGVWDRWNALSPGEQATGFLEHDARLVHEFEALTPDQRETLAVEMGFLPFPVPIAAVAGMRLNEAALHGWDVHIALDPAAALDSAAAAVLAEQFAGGIGFLLGFIGKADAISAPALVDIQGSGFGILVSDAVSLTTAVNDPTATFVGPLEAAIRLISGRLAARFTPVGTEVTGAVSLDDLRRVFPGF